MKTMPIANSDTRMSSEELIDRTKALLPAIAQRASQAELDRRIPQQTIDELRAAGLYRVMQPVRWGGFGLDFDTYFEICWRISSACGSTGWVYSQSAVQNWEMSFAPESAQADFYANSDVLSCSAFNPAGANVESIADGWKVSGRWRFSSGCFHADWALLGARVPEFKKPILVIVPKTDFRIEDTWDVSGLCATGSNDIVIDEPIFIPRYRHIATAPEEQSKPSNPNGSYGVPMPSIAPWGVVVPVIGMAQGALEAYEAATRTRLTAFEGRPVSEMVGPQIRISEASAKIDAARALARADIREAIQRGAAGDNLSDEDRIRLRRDHAYIVNMCFEATMLIARAAGASSLFKSNPIQRFVRDVHAGAMQVSTNWDEQAEAYGRVKMGQIPNSMMW